MLSQQMTTIIGETLVALKESLEQEIIEYSRLLDEKEATLNLLIPFTTAKTMEN